MFTWYSHSPTSVLKLILLATVFGVCSASHSSSNQITSRAGQPQALSGRKSPDQVVFGYIYTIPNSNANDLKHRYIRTTPTSRVESAPSDSLSDHSTHTATLEDANSAGAPPVIEANPRQDEAAFAAVQRLEALMGTGSYQCYFPGPNYYNAFVPQNYCQGKSSVSKTQLKDVDFAYLPKTVDAKNTTIEDHIARFLGKKPPSIHVKANKTDKATKIRNYLSNIIIVAQLFDDRYAFLVPSTISNNVLHIQTEANSHDMPAATWETWKKIKSKVSKGMPTKFVYADMKIGTL
ncbi:hypothetical protein F5879DRAFT_989435 [Lentinula edodes]|uniref:uncharacterized protein n=1 Tax=Lentinula edodes TaxID=5353 RepID=UPI001E8CFCB3|nr:uncharacterized protein C8R40DRAFT_1267872 [Lentinula edodes]KAH7870762.1 hypothetical protein C8R40DRAFT_1267872 [Lentinula edodes]KAJ3904202.1 hypothetical protein F5879DRAFT_989435 [Lentinula edodes]